MDANFAGMVIYSLRAGELQRKLWGSGVDRGKDEAADQPGE